MRIEILGTSFSVRTDEDPEYLREVVEHFRSKVQEVQATGTTSDPLKLAILAGLLTADEYLKLNGASRREDEQAKAIAQQLIGELNQVLEGSSPAGSE
jgi:cell division protein ZapA (FtsZ GTPase activity inhibitor)